MILITALDAGTWQPLRKLVRKAGKYRFLLRDIKTVSFLYSFNLANSAAISKRDIQNLLKNSKLVSVSERFFPPDSSWN
jgi:hypothetical protein